LTGRRSPRVAGFATQGTASNDEQRLTRLLSEVEGAEVWPLERRGRLTTALRLAGRIARERPDLVVMEGTGILGGAVLLAARLLGTRYVVSSGDAVGPFIAGAARGAGWLGGAYERLLCRACAGFVGWTPYLTGRALTFGAPRAMTAPGWGLPPAAPGDRARVRESWGVDDRDLVFGIVGSLTWSSRYGYCYGMELVRAAARVTRADVAVVVVGDGDGREQLQQAIAAGGCRVILPGRVPRDQVPSVLAALDVGSLPQSVDRVGMFRYTTKLPEYLAAGVPVVTGQLPLAYDLDGGWLHRLPGSSPWDERYIAALAELMNGAERGEIERLRDQVPRALPLFDEAAQLRRFAAFVSDILDARA
jgi:hypothetical protein